MRLITMVNLTMAHNILIDKMGLDEFTKEGYIWGTRFLKICLYLRWLIPIREV